MYFGIAVKGDDILTLHMKTTVICTCSLVDSHCLARWPTARFVTALSLSLECTVFVVQFYREICKGME